MRGQSVVLAAILALVLWAWSKQKEVVAPGATTTPKVIPPSITKPVTEMAPLVSTVNEFADVYGISKQAAIDTARRFKASPNSDEFRNLSSRDRQNLLRISELLSLTPEDTKTTTKPGVDVSIDTTAPTPESALTITPADISTTAIIWTPDKGFHAVSKDSPEFKETQVP